MEARNRRAVAFLAAVDRPSVDGREDVGDALEAALAAAVAAAEGRWGKLLPDEDFVGFLAAKLAGGGPLLEALADLRVVDLYLVAACLARAPGAAELFELELGPHVERALGAMRLADSVREEVRQQLRCDLFAPPAGRASALVGYAGRGDLRGWVRTVAVHGALAFLRHERRAPLVDDDDGLVAMPAPGDDPELALVKRRYAAEFERALREAMAALATADRLLLRMYFVDGLTVEQLGAMRRVHKATISRRLARVRQDVLDAALALLLDRLRVDPDELESIFRAVKSQVQLSIGAHLSP